MTCLAAAEILRDPMATTSALPLTDVLRALADAGASDHLLGQVVRELVVSKATSTPDPAAPASSSTAATLLRAPSAAAGSAPPAGLAPSSTVPGPGMSLLSSTPSAAMPSAALATAPHPSRFSGSLTMAAEPVVVNFRKNGKRSSVYFTPAKWMELVGEVGNEAATLDLVKQYAAISPDQGNRSAWVQDAVRRSGGMAPTLP